MAKYGNMMKETGKHMGYSASIGTMGIFHWQTTYGKSRKLEDSGQILELSIKDVGFHNETLGSSDLNFNFLCNAPSKMLDLAIKHSGMANV